MVQTAGGLRTPRRKRVTELTHIQNRRAAATKTEFRDERQEPPPSKTNELVDDAAKQGPDDKKVASQEELMQEQQKVATSRRVVRSVSRGRRNDLVQKVRDNQQKRDQVLKRRFQQPSVTDAPRPNLATKQDAVEAGEKTSNIPDHQQTESQVDNDENVECASPKATSIPSKSTPTRRRRETPHHKQVVQKLLVEHRRLNHGTAETNSPPPPQKSPQRGREVAPSADPPSDPKLDDKTTTAEPKKNADKPQQHKNRKISLREKAMRRRTGSAPPKARLGSSDLGISDEKQQPTSKEESVVAEESVAAEPKVDIQPKNESRGHGARRSVGARHRSRDIEAAKSKHQSASKYVMQGVHKKQEQPPEDEKKQAEDDDNVSESVQRPLSVSDRRRALFKKTVHPSPSRSPSPSPSRGIFRSKSDGRRASEFEQNSFSAQLQGHKHYISTLPGSFEEQSLTGSPSSEQHVPRLGFKLAPFVDPMIDRRNRLPSPKRKKERSIVNHKPLLLDLKSRSVSDSASMEQEGQSNRGDSRRSRLKRVNSYQSKSEYGSPPEHEESVEATSPRRIAPGSFSDSESIFDAEDERASRAYPFLGLKATGRRDSHSESDEGLSPNQRPRSLSRPRISIDPEATGGGDSLSESDTGSSPRQRPRSLSRPRIGALTARAMLQHRPTSPRRESKTSTPKESSPLPNTHSNILKERKEAESANKDSGIVLDSRAENDRKAMKNEPTIQTQIDDQITRDTPISPSKRVSREQRKKVVRRHQQMRQKESSVVGEVVVESPTTGKHSLSPHPQSPTEESPSIQSIQDGAPKTAEEMDYADVNPQETITAYLQTNDDRDKVHHQLHDQEEHDVAHTLEASAVSHSEHPSDFIQNELSMQEEESAKASSYEPYAELQKEEASWAMNKSNVQASHSRSNEDDDDDDDDEWVDFSTWAYSKPTIPSKNSSKTKSESARKSATAPVQRNLSKEEPVQRSSSKQEQAAPVQRNSSKEEQTALVQRNSQKEEQIACDSPKASSLPPQPSQKTVLEDEVTPTRTDISKTGTWESHGSASHSPLEFSPLPSNHLPDDGDSETAEIKQETEPSKDGKVMSQEKLDATAPSSDSNSMRTDEKVQELATEPMAEESPDAPPPPPPPLSPAEIPTMESANDNGKSSPRGDCPPPVKVDSSSSQSNVWEGTDEYEADESEGDGGEGSKASEPGSNQSIAAIENEQPMPTPRRGNTANIDSEEQVQLNTSLIDQMDTDEESFNYDGVKCIFDDTSSIANTVSTIGPSSIAHTASLLGGQVELISPRHAPSMPQLAIEGLPSDFEQNQDEGDGGPTPRASNTFDKAAPPPPPPPPPAQHRRHKSRGGDTGENPVSRSQSPPLAGPGAVIPPPPPPPGTKKKKKKARPSAVSKDMDTIIQKEETLPVVEEVLVGQSSTMISDLKADDKNDSSTSEAPPQRNESSPVQTDDSVHLSSCDEVLAMKQESTGVTNGPDDTVHDAVHPSSDQNMIQDSSTVTNQPDDTVHPSFDQAAQQESLSATNSAIVHTDEAPHQVDYVQPEESAASETDQGPVVGSFDYAISTDNHEILGVSSTLSDLNEEIAVNNSDADAIIDAMTQRIASITQRLTDMETSGSLEGDMKGAETPVLNEAYLSSSDESDEDDDDMYTMGMDGNVLGPFTTRGYGSGQEAAAIPEVEVSLPDTDNVDHTQLAYVGEAPLYSEQSKEEPQLPDEDLEIFPGDSGCNIEVAVALPHPAPQTGKNSTNFIDDKTTGESSTTKLAEEGDLALSRASIHSAAGETSPLEHNVNESNPSPTLVQSEEVESSEILAKEGPINALNQDVAEESIFKSEKQSSVFTSEMAPGTTFGPEAHAGGEGDMQKETAAELIAPYPINDQNEEQSLCQDKIEMAPVVEQIEEQATNNSSDKSSKEENHVPYSSNLKVSYPTAGALNMAQPSKEGVQYSDKPELLAVDYGGPNEVTAHSIAASVEAKEGKMIESDTITSKESPKQDISAKTQVPSSTRPEMPSEGVGPELMRVKASEAEQLTTEVTAHDDIDPAEATTDNEKGEVSSNAAKVQAQKGIEVVTVAEEVMLCDEVVEATTDREEVQATSINTPEPSNEAPVQAAVVDIRVEKDVSVQMTGPSGTPTLKSVGLLAEDEIHTEHVEAEAVDQGEMICPLETSAPLSSEVPAEEDNGTETVEADVPVKKVVEDAMEIVEPFKTSVLVSSEALGEDNIKMEAAETGTLPENQGAAMPMLLSSGVPVEDDIDTETVEADTVTANQGETTPVLLVDEALVEDVDTETVEADTVAVDQHEATGPSETPALPSSEVLVEDEIDTETIEADTEAGEQGETTGPSETPTLPSSEVPAEDEIDMETIEADTEAEEQGETTGPSKTPALPSSEALVEDEIDMETIQADTEAEEQGETTDTSETQDPVQEGILEEVAATSPHAAGQVSSKSPPYVKDEDAALSETVLVTPSNEMEDEKRAVEMFDAAVEAEVGSQSETPFFIGDFQSLGSKPDSVASQPSSQMSTPENAMLERTEESLLSVEEDIIGPPNNNDMAIESLGSKPDSVASQPSSQMSTPENAMLERTEESLLSVEEDIIGPPNNNDMAIENNESISAKEGHLFGPLANKVDEGLVEGIECLSPDMSQTPKSSNAAQLRECESSSPTPQHTLLDSTKEVIDILGLVDSARVKTAPTKNTAQTANAESGLSADRLETNRASQNIEQTTGSLVLQSPLQAQKCEQETTNADKRENLQSQLGTDVQQANHHHQAAKGELEEVEATARDVTRLPSQEKEPKCQQVGASGTNIEGVGAQLHAEIASSQDSEAKNHSEGTGTEPATPAMQAKEQGAESSDMYEIARSPSQESQNTLERILGSIQSSSGSACTSEVDRLLNGSSTVVTAEGEMPAFMVAKTHSTKNPPAEILATGSADASELSGMKTLGALPDNMAKSVLSAEPMILAEEEEHSGTSSSSVHGRGSGQVAMVPVASDINVQAFGISDMPATSDSSKLASDINVQASGISDMPATNDSSKLAAEEDEEVEPLADILAYLNETHVPQSISDDNHEETTSVHPAPVGKSDSDHDPEPFFLNFMDNSASMAENEEGEGIAELLSEEHTTFSHHTKDEGVPSLTSPAQVERLVPEEHLFTSFQETLGMPQHAEISKESLGDEKKTDNSTEQQNKTLDSGSRDSLVDYSSSSNSSTAESSFDHHVPASTSNILQDEKLAEKIDFAISAAAQRFEQQSYPQPNLARSTPHRDTFPSKSHSQMHEEETPRAKTRIERTLIVPPDHPSPFERCVRVSPGVLGHIMSFLGDPVVVCKMKSVNCDCNNFVAEHMHSLIQDAVRLGGISMQMRPAFWMWVALDQFGDSSPDLKTTSSLEGTELEKLEHVGMTGKWHHLIERDVCRSFGNLPPHKTGARLRTDSIVRALATWGQSRTMKRGVRGSGDPPPPSPDDSQDENSDDISLAPTDTVSEWGGVTPVGSFANTSFTSDLDAEKRGNSLGNNGLRSTDEMALSGNALTDATKMVLQRKLGFVLHALAAAHPDVGYCQGMDYVVAHLLRLLQETVRWGAAHNRLPHVIQLAPDVEILPSMTEEEVAAVFSQIDESLVVEETCFRMMDTFFTAYNLGHFYYPELRCLKTCCLVFERLIKIKLPVLADHFEHHELNVGLFALGWFQTLFLYLPSMPTATVSHMWDIWLVERSFKIFFRVATAILFLSQPILLNHELEGMMGYLNTFPDATLLSPDILIACALQIKVTNKLLMELELEVAQG